MAEEPEQLHFGQPYLALNSATESRNCHWGLSRWFCGVGEYGAICLGGAVENRGGTMYRHAWQVSDGFKVTERRDHQYVSDCYCAYSRDNSVWDRHGCCKVDCITACGCCPCATVVHCCCLPCACAKRAKRLPKEIMHTTVKYNLIITPSGSWEEYWREQNHIRHRYCQPSYCVAPSLNPQNGCTRGQR